MKKLALICISIIFFAACTKSIEELPPATETGANTFGAKVNGELWTPKGFGPFPANTILVATLYPDGDLKIKAQNFSSSPTETEFEIFIKGITGPGTYPLNSNVNYPSFAASYGYFIKRKLTPVDEWITSATTTGSVTITKFDVANRIISGTFQFNAASIYNPSQILSVTEGRFDVKAQ